MKKILLIFILFIYTLFFNQTTYYPAHNPQRENRSFAEIMESGVIKVLLDYNSVNYFLYKGTPMGFNFDILQQFANYSNLKLEIEVKDNLEDNFGGFINGGYDVLASNLTVTDDRKKVIAFTEPVAYTKQVLVQRTKSSIAGDDKNQLFVSSFSDLFSPDVIIQVRKNAAFGAQLSKLSSLMYDTIRYKEVNSETERLIEAVALGEIDYTVCDENIAENYKRIYPNIDFSFTLSNNQPLSWAVNKDAELLKKYIDNWLTNFVETAEYKNIYARYFGRYQYKDMHNSGYYSFQSNQISEFDKNLKYLSEKIGWDWKLVSALVYQESRFNPNARSWAGAFGLMQLMPGTAKRFGVDQTSSVQHQIKAGVSLLNVLDKRYFQEIQDKEERIKFVLAAYNAGAGHVEDARRLAQKYGKDPNVWFDNVDFFMLQKANPEYYTDTIVKYGYSRGKETYDYVNKIMELYGHYENLLE